MAIAASPHDKSPTSKGRRARAVRHLLPFDSLSIDRGDPASLPRQLYWQLRRMIEERLSLIHISEPTRPY